jgi:hypothetical protein
VGPDKRPMPVVESDGRTPESAPRTLAGDHADRPLVSLQRGCHGRARGDRWQDPICRTKDQNIDYIAEYLTAVGINLREVRVVGDEERAIIDALNALRRPTPMFSSPAGSGRPTVTSPPTAWRRRSVCRLTAIRARSPYCIMDEDDRSRDEPGPPAHDAHSQVRGSHPQQVSGAPGFWIGNVIVMAGVPSIMQAMLDEVA